MDEDLSLPWEGPFPWHSLGEEGEEAPLEPVESGRSASFGPSEAPPESAGSSRSTLSGPSEQREGSKWQHADEVQLGLGGLTPKCHRPVVSM